MSPNRIQVLRLYKDLLRYGDMLTLTNKNYFKKRIRQEFNNNKDIGLEEITFFYKEYVERSWEKHLQHIMENYFRSQTKFIKPHVFLKISSVQLIPFRSKRAIDKSKFPTLHESDLVEHFIKGGGPGGQNVNKTNSCIYLLHKPSGLSVKVQKSRDQAQNRQIARERLTKALDNFINKECSIENQKKQILLEKSIRRTQKQKKLKEMKNRWKQIINEYS